MRSIEFNEMNAKIADDQDQYETIFAFVDDKENSITACFQFSKIEIDEIIKTGKIWYKQRLYDKNSRMQPIEISVDKDKFIPKKEDAE